MTWQKIGTSLTTPFDLMISLPWNSEFSSGAEDRNRRASAWPAANSSAVGGPGSDFGGTARSDKEREDKTSHKDGGENAAHYLGHRASGII